MSSFYFRISGCITMKAKGRGFSLHLPRTLENQVDYRKLLASAAKHLFIYALAFTTIIPFVWLISSSLKWERDIFAFPIQWIPNPPRWENYAKVFERLPFGLYYLNTLKIALTVLVIQVLTCSMAAFSFTKLRYPGRSVLLVIYIATLMVPSQVTLIPQFIIVRSLKLFNTHLGLILLDGFSAFGIFMLVQFFRGVPNEMMDAAKIDGANLFTTYSRVVMPMSKPALSALAIMSIIGSFNDFMRPMIYLNTDDLRTITLGLRTFVTKYASEINLQMAGTVMALVPILIVYIVAQEQIIRGISFNGGLKG